MTRYDMAYLRALKSWWGPA